MKFLYLLGSRLMLYYQKRKLLFLLFCFCGMATTLSFLFFYGLLPSVTNRNSEETKYKYFTVGNILSELSEETLLDLQNDPMVERITLEHTGVEGVKKKIRAETSEKSRIKVLMGEGSFEDAEPYSAIEEFFPGKGPIVGETVKIGDRDFTIIGVYFESGLGTYIPLETYLEMGLSTERAVVYAAERSTVESGAMMERLKEAFGEDIQVEMGTEARKDDERMSETILWNRSVTYVAAIIVFLFLFLQMVESTGRETAIFRTFGATAGKILLLHFCEILLLSGVSGLAGCILHAVLYEPVFSHLYSIYVPYYFGDYLFVFALVIGITLLISIPYVIRCLFLSPKEAALTAAK